MRYYVMLFIIEGSNSCLRNLILEVHLISDDRIDPIISFFELSSLLQNPKVNFLIRAEQLRTVLLANMPLALQSLGSDSNILKEVL